MEVDSAFSIYYFSSLSLLVTLFITTLFCFLSLFAFRFSPLQKSKPIQSSNAIVSDPKSFHKTCNCKCSCHGCDSGGGEAAVVVHKADRQTGASMMEQLVPEVTTHALSYLDYLSLCRLSMTNSLMRKAANDDNAWKSLYHKDFTLEQDSITPVKGWKAYYAATRAILNLNMDFYNIIRERSLSAMGDLWLNADYVKCIHASGEYFTGYKAVMESWQLCFNWEQGVDFQIQDAWARVLTDVAWVTMKTYIVDEETVSFKVTHVFEFHNERWYMVHHHSFPM